MTNEKNEKREVQEIRKQRERERERERGSTFESVDVRIESSDEYITIITTLMCPSQEVRPVKLNGRAQANIVLLNQIKSRVQEEIVGEGERKVYLLLYPSHQKGTTMIVSPRLCISSLFRVV